MAKTKGNPKVNRHKLHKYLHKQLGGRPGEIRKTELAEDLGLDTAHLGRIIKELVEQGRLVLIGRGPNNVGIYSSKDPDTFADGDAPPERPRTVAWG